MRKKRKLTKFGEKVVITGIIILTIVIFKLINKGLNNFKEQAFKCDLAKGYTCTYYEIKNYVNE